MKVAIVSSNLGAGGAERQLTLLAAALAAAGDRVDIILLNGPDQGVYFDLDPSIGLIHLDAERPSGSLLQALRNGQWRLRLLVHALRRSSPDIVVAVLPEAMIYAAIAARRLRVPFLASQRNNPAEDLLSPRWSMLQSLSFRFANAIVFQTERARMAAPARFAAKGTVIPNIVRPASGPGPDRASKVVVGVGQLVPAKGFDVLLHAFSTVHERYPEWRLRIYGSGPEQERLEQLSRALDLADSGAARLCGVSERPLGWMDGASIFVLSSRTEGFPNVLCEAMAHGFPCVAADCSFGPSEVIEPGVNGLRVTKEDPNALAEALCHLIAQVDERQALGKEARGIARFYSAASIAARWKDLMTSLAPENR
jgi:glycosyltransferase involved in cell wall biosynthesis